MRLPKSCWTSAMRFSADLRSMSSRLNALSRFTEGKNTLSILRCFKLTLSGNELLVTANNYVCNVIGVFQVRGAGDGSICVEADIFKRVCATLGGEAEVSVIDGQLTIKHGKLEQSLPVLSASDFARIKVGEAPKEIIIDGKRLFDCVSRVSFACAKIETRYVLMGINIKAQSGIITLTATNGKQIATACFSIDGEAEFNITIPSQSLSSFAALFSSEEIAIKVGAAKTQFVSPSYIATLSNTDGEFPDCSRYFSNHSPKSSVRIDKDTLLAVISRALVFADDTDNTLVANINGDELSITPLRARLGGSLESMRCNGDVQWSYGFNGSQYREAIERIGDDELHIKIPDTRDFSDVIEVSGASSSTFRFVSSQCIIPRQNNQGEINNA